ncbi:MAG: rod shape-determining protein [Christensenellales bacterium]
MSCYELCIDMGSCYTTIYKKNSGIVLREPTLAILQTSGKNMKVLKMGIEAQQLYGKISDDEVFVRPVVDGVVKNISLTQKILEYFLGKVIQYRFVKPAIKVVACLPVGLKKEEYEDIKKMYYAVGFAKIDFVYGSVCASFAGSPYLAQNRANLIVDIGGGKTEISCITNGKIISACSANVGGNFVDRAIVEQLQHSKNYIINQNLASKIKCEIGSLYETDTSSMEVVVQESSANSQITTVVHARDITKPICESYFKIAQLIQAFLGDCSPEVVEDIQKSGIVVCGGGAKMTGLEAFFKKVLKLSVFVLDNPEVASVLGSEKLFGDYNMLQKVKEEN